ncbi:MAG: RtcB family protein [Chthoniobacterales bacterium]
MNTHDLIQLGIPELNGDALKLARSHMARLFASGLDRPAVELAFEELIAHPKNFLRDEKLRSLAQALLRPAYTPRAELAPWKSWGGENLEPESIKQMTDACALPVSVAGALMPDTHVGYGLPIGGVLATENAVIPYAVGVDIACRMRLSIYRLPGNRVAGMQDRLARVLEEETSFGLGAEFRKPREHAVMDADWSVSKVTQRCKDKAWRQLGTSGSGNHFVEFGEIELREDNDLNIPSGNYLALLSHSGSRGTGAQVCEHYSKLAMENHPELPGALRRLAWLDLDDELGAEYWAAMNLMGLYAAANHECIHREIARALGIKVLTSVENHHNFAWKEKHEVGGLEHELIVHRKGATPAGKGVLGVIPGSMTAPGFLVRGRGNPQSLRSAAHGAGRVMSRSKAKTSFTWSGVKKELADAGVKVLSAGIDEVPGVYKDIHSVMDAQKDLVEILGTFQPRLVKMADGKDRAED